MVWDPCKIEKKWLGDKVGARGIYFSIVSLASVTARKKDIPNPTCRGWEWESALQRDEEHPTQQARIDRNLQ